MRCSTLKIIIIITISRLKAHIVEIIDRLTVKMFYL